MRKKPKSTPPSPRPPATPQEAIEAAAERNLPASTALDMWRLHETCGVTALLDCAKISAGLLRKCETMQAALERIAYPPAATLGLSSLAIERQTLATAREALRAIGWQPKPAAAEAASETEAQS